MTELEKMMKGQAYNGNDPEIMQLWHRGKRLCHNFNSLPSDAENERSNVLSELLGKKGDNLWIASPFYVDYGINIYFGVNCEVNMNCTFLDDNKIIIGDNVLIAPNVQIYTAFHPFSFSDRYDTHNSLIIHTAPVIIGENSWIGGGTIILPGVTIGKNVSIGAGSVVTKSIPDNKIAYGNPCRIISQI